MHAAMYRQMLGCRKLASISTSSMNAFNRGAGRFVWHIAESTCDVVQCDVMWCSLI